MADRSKKERAKKALKGAGKAKESASAADPEVLEATVVLDEADDIPELDSGDLEGPVVDVDTQETETALAVAKPRRLPEQLNALDVYLARLKDVVILPVEEQAQLAIRYQDTGDSDAGARLVASNLRLVAKIAFQFRRQWADIMDLIAEGNVGLVEAVRKFDAERGVPFPSYARFWIRARILAFIQENKHLVHTGSRAARKLFWRLERERRALRQEGQDPTPKRLAARVGVEVKDVEELAPILDHRPTSLDLPAHGDDDTRTRGDNLSDARVSNPEQVASGEQMQDILRATFARFRGSLDERDRAIWDDRLQAEDPLRLEDLGQRFGVSKERIRQLEARIKTQLKAYLEEELGDEVLIEALHE